MNMSISNAMNGQPQVGVPGGLQMSAAQQQQLQAVAAAQAAAVQHAQAQAQAHAQAQAQAQAHAQAQAQAAAAALMGMGQLGHHHPQHPMMQLQGLPQGLQQGLQQGLPQGLPQGLQQGLQNGIPNHVALHPPPPGLAGLAQVRVPHPAARPEPKRCEIYKFTASKQLYSAAWSLKKNEKFRLAVGTLVEREHGNRVSIIQLDEGSGQLIEKSSFAHEFAPNCIRFIPDPENNYPDLIATSSDMLRLHRIGPDGHVRPGEDTVLTSNKSTQYTAALTSFDWNEVDPRLIGTASIDTTCTIFDVEVGSPISTFRPTQYGVKTQLIAHDKPVHDIGFSRVYHGKDHFATVGADGSCRMFDLRNLEHSTIVYEDPHKTGLMRLAWNKHEPFHLATFAENSTEVVIIDIRVPCQPLSRLKNHTGAVNGIAWAPHSSSHICTAGDDAQALIWDVNNMPRPIEDPILAYAAGGEVSQVHWGAAHTNWICIVFNKSLEILRV